MGILEVNLGLERVHLQRAMMLHLWQLLGHQVAIMIACEPLPCPGRMKSPSMAVLALMPRCPVCHARQKAKPNLVEKALSNADLSALCMASCWAC